MNMNPIRLLLASILVLALPIASYAADAVKKDASAPLPASLAADPANSIQKMASAKPQPDNGNGNSQLNAANQPFPPLPNVAAAPTPAQVKEESYADVVNQDLPMTPDMIRRLRRLLDEQQRAKSELPFTPPKLENRTVLVKGDPGESPPVIRISQNFLTSLVFTDATGMPWPIKTFGGGNDELFTVSNPDPVNAKNVLVLSTTASYVYSNVQVILEGRPSPIMLTVVSGQKSNDYITNVAVQARGPNAQAPIISNGSNFQTSPIMTAFMDGIPPAKSVKLSSSDTRLEAWQFDGKYYIRTRMTMYSPAWTNHHASADGMQAYEITPTPVLVAGEDGHPQQVVIGDK